MNYNIPRRLEDDSVYPFPDQWFGLKMRRIPMWYWYTWFRDSEVPSEGTVLKSVHSYARRKITAFECEPKNIGRVGCRWIHNGVKMKLLMKGEIMPDGYTFGNIQDTTKQSQPESEEKKRRISETLSKWSKTREGKKHFKKLSRIRYRARMNKKRFRRMDNSQ